MNRHSRPANWTTLLDPEFTREFGLEVLHSAWWMPPQWPGKGTVVSLSIPECELQVVFADRPSELVAFVNGPQANWRIKHWLRFACSLAVEYHAALHVTADTAEQIEVAARRIAKLLPHFERAALRPRNTNEEPVVVIPDAGAKKA